MKQELSLEGEGVAASGDRQGQTPVDNGIEVVEHVTPDHDIPHLMLVGEPAEARRHNGRIPRSRRDGPGSETDGTRLAAMRQAEAFGLAQAEWLRREIDLRARIADLEERVCQVRGRQDDPSPATRASTDSGEGAGNGPGGERPEQSSSGMAVGLLDRHTVNMDVVESLKERVLERGRALAVTREELEAVRRDRDRLAAILASREAAVARLIGQGRRAHADRSLSSDVRLALQRLFNREQHGYEPVAAPPAAASTDPAPNPGPTVPPAEAGLSGSAGVPDALPLPAELTDPGADRAPVGQAMGAHRPVRSGLTPQATGTSRKRLLRYLIPERVGCAVIELSGRRCYVGRGDEADIRINDPSVSRVHGVLYCVGGATIVEDARSTNGVIVNGCKVHQLALRDGDRVAFGGARFQFRVSIVDAGS